MNGFDWVAVIAALIALLDLGWHIASHLLERSVRLKWQVSAGMGERHPEGYVGVLLVNRGRDVLIDSIAISRRGADPDSPLCEPPAPVPPEVEAMLKKAGKEKRLSPFLARSEADMLGRGDSKYVEIGTPFKDWRRWAGDSIGVSVRLRDGREKFVTRNEIDAPRPQAWRLWRSIGWLTRA